MACVLIPDTLEELLALRRRHPGALLLAGGTDLLVQRRGAAADEAALLWIGKISELKGVREEDDSLVIGAATPLAAIIADPLVRRHAPLLVQALRTVGAPAIRNMATLGGNIITASPAGDSLPALYLMDALLELTAGRETRRMPIATFITGPRRTALQPGELLTRIRLPLGQAFTRQQVEKVGRRKALAIAVASLAAMARLSDDGRIDAIRLAWGSVGPTVMRFPELERRLIGARLDPEQIRDAVDSVRRGVAPIDDIRAPAEYRRRVAGNLLIRFLEGLNG